MPLAGQRHLHPLSARPDGAEKEADQEAEQCYLEDEGWRAEDLHGTLPWTNARDLPPVVDNGLCQTEPSSGRSRTKLDAHQAGDGEHGVEPTQSAGPDPRRVHDLKSLAAELDLLRKRAAKGRGQRMVSFSLLTSLLGLPATNKSTIHGYMTGKTLPPPDVLDQIVIALGATEDEQADWGNAWFQAEGSQHKSGEISPSPTAATQTSAVESLTARLRATLEYPFDIATFSAHNLDLVHQVDVIAPDHEAQIPAPQVAPGGSGANTAVALSLLGIRTSTIGAVANDWRGTLLRKSLGDVGVDTSLLLRVDGNHESGHTLVFADGDGRRLIYVHPGANELLAGELRHRHLQATLIDRVEKSRWLHLSSFTSTRERLLQQAVATGMKRQKVLSITPGTLYSVLGADKIAPLLQRGNVLFAYEQQLDLLLERSSAVNFSVSLSLIDKMRVLFKWRANQIAAQPLLVVVKRPIDLKHGQANNYLTIGAGHADLEEVCSPDTGSHRRDIVDATGAGDALAAGVVAGLLHGLDLTECSNLAFTMALCASSGLGARANLPTREALLERWRYYLPDVPIPTVFASL